jgi:hypothetical protein
MWQIDNETNFSADRAFARDFNGAEVWIVAVRGTFTINKDETLEIAEEQTKVCDVPKYSNDPTSSSLLYDSDLILKKPNTDIILHGCAYAPREKPTTEVKVKMSVGNISKELQIFGDRFWEKRNLGFGITAPIEFLKMPIIYEKAYGGFDQQSKNTQDYVYENRNPIGTGFAWNSENLDGKRLPNIENPQELISSWRQHPRPVGFGPIPGHWSPRLELAGTYDEKWKNERLPLLPLDFDECFYQFAPKDQQANGYLNGGEQIELINLSPNGSLKFKLPTVKLRFITEIGNESVEHEQKLHTVIIEPEFPRVIMVWHTSLPCHNKESKLKETVIIQEDVKL